MVCNFEMTEEQLRLALAAIEKAKERGFSHTTAVVHLSSVNPDGTKVMASFSNGVILKAHPTDPNQNWGHTSTWPDDVFGASTETLSLMIEQKIGAGNK